MRPEILYLTDMVEAADAIGRFLTQARREEFYGDEVLQSAILQKLIVIGEASARLSAAFRDQYPEVPWADIVGFRNIAVHEYFAVSWPIVWVTATQDVPALREQIATLLDDEFTSPSTKGKYETQTH
ncbi:MAG: DUF86 domain-containing protein [Chloroflexota bacterium]|nr:DUF86 domain-containing protein [Chloroflexota bacterium]